MLAAAAAAATGDTIRLTEIAMASTVTTTVTTTVAQQYAYHNNVCSVESHVPRGQEPRATVPTSRRFTVTNKPLTVQITTNLSGAKIAGQSGDTPVLILMSTGDVDNWKEFFPS